MTDKRISSDNEEISFPGLVHGITRCRQAKEPGRKNRTRFRSYNLTLILVASLVVWLANSFINARAAPENSGAIGLSLPAEALINREIPATEILISQQAVTQTNSVIYFPLIVHRLCATSFGYNETIRYNLAGINIEEAWSSCYQGQDITVAVIDTGVDLDHPDLQANLISGKSFVSGTSSADDDYGHGTHVAGIIAGVNNNGGIIGVAPKANIMPIKVLDEDGNGSIYDLVEGLEWATEHQAQVINISLGSISNSATLKEAVDYAYNQGVLLVAAAGNCGDSSYYLNGCYYQDQPLYPGAYDNVIAVAATDTNDNQSSFSNQGSYIEIAAPGSNIFSTYLAGGYATMSGTSMATPHVAGLAALIWSQNPDWTNQQVRSQINNTAEDLGASGWDNQFGYGRIDAAAAMDTLQDTSMVTAKIASAENSPAVANDSQVSYIPGEVLLKLQTGYTVNNVLDQAQVSAAEVKVAGAIDQIGVQKLTVTPGQEQVWLAQFDSSKGVEYAELNYVVTIIETLK